MSLDKNDMPRERLIKLGAKSLSDYELLAILLRTGTKEMDVLTLAKTLLKKTSLVQLKNITVEELIMNIGIKKAKATTIIAALELGSRISNSEEQLIKIQNTKDIYQLVKKDLNNLSQEHFIIIYLNVNREVIKKELKYIGTHNQILLQPREIFTEAIKYNAPSIIMVHNHPSGNSMPSEADLYTTKQMFRVAEIVGITVFDHVIVGKHEFFSMKESKKYYTK